MSVNSTGKVSSRDRKRDRMGQGGRKGGVKGAKLRDRRKEVTKGCREGQLAGRGKKQAFASSLY